MRISKEIVSLGSKALVFLAAAVSDFYLPENRLSDHKIQSDDGSLRLILEPVPKLIHIITKNWAPKAFTVSFKLETDPALLIPKAKSALQLYGHHVVVANLLKDRKKEVIIIQQDGSSACLRVDDPNLNEIEELLVHHLVDLHRVHLNKG